MVLPDREVRLQLSPKRAVLFRRGRQREQRAAIKHGVGELGRLYTKRVRGGTGSAEIDAPSGVPAGAGLLEHGTFEYDH